MKPQYEPKTEQQHLGYLAEESGEVLAAVGKSLRWGLDSSNPELPPEQRETNADWLWREIRDLEGAVKRMKNWLTFNGHPEKEPESARELCQWPKCDCPGKYADCKIDGHPLDD